MNLDHHPCFNPKACASFGRVHLPVAPRCNIQCRFCNRKFDCVNETRPGVTSSLLSPGQAMAYLEQVFTRRDNIAVVGIAGPGDPFANPDETLETMAGVRSRYPEAILCVATNGMVLPPFVDELKRLNVSHVTVTVNAVDPDISADIYSWMRIGKRVVRGREGAELLLENQMKSIQALKRRGIIVKVNSIILPGINEDHIEAVSRQVGEMGVDLFNAMPYYPSPGSDLEHLSEPDKSTVEQIRKKAAVHVKQMRHCSRCRADAVGMLGESMDGQLAASLEDCARLEVLPSTLETFSGKKPAKPSRDYVAVASMEGVLVNQHLGEADQLLIYGQKKDGTISLVETRRTPKRGGGDLRWKEMAGLLSDCSTLLVSGVGQTPRAVLSGRGVDVFEVEGLIEGALDRVFAGRSLNPMVRRAPRACGTACSGTGMGCG